VTPAETLRIALVGGGAGVTLAALVWLGLVGLVVAPSLPSGIPAAGVAALGFPALGFPGTVVAVVVGYCHLLVGVGLAALGLAVRDPDGAGPLPDLDVAERTRRRIGFDTSLSVLAAVVLVCATVTWRSVPLLTVEVHPVAFVLRLVFLLALATHVGRLWKPAERHSERIRRGSVLYERFHRYLESLPDRHPRWTRSVRYGAVASVPAGVALLVAASGLGEWTPTPLVAVPVGLALGALPLSALVGALPGPDSPAPDEPARIQRTMVVAGVVLLCPGTLLAVGLFLAFGGSPALAVGYVLPLPITPADPPTLGAALVLSGYGWRILDRLETALSRRWR